MNIALSGLWLPILLSAIIVFMTSSIIWMFMQYHNSDWKPLPDEDAVRGALSGTPPGQYSLPHAADNKARQSVEWQEKFKNGPAGMIIVIPHGSLAMGKQLGQWLVYCIVISILVAYVASVSLAAGAEYLKVFQVVGTVATLAYSGSAAMGAIWFGHQWSRTSKDILDGIIYGLLTAGCFGWLWPAL